MDSYRPFRIEQRPASHMPFWLQILLLALGAGLLAFTLNLFVFQSYYVDGESMAPTLHSEDRLIISKVEKTAALIQRQAYIPERGQIIVIDGEASPATADSAPHLIKRVVAVPGDRLVIRSGVATIYTPQQPAGTGLDALLGLQLEPTFTNEPIDVTVPDGSVFVMGDNRRDGGSYDSRSFGVVDSRYIAGRLWVRILPLDQSRVF